MYLIKSTKADPQRAREYWRNIKSWDQ